jgi:hypothetical protein
MRVINVVVIKEGVIDNIDSFGVFEEQLVEDVVKPAEELFREKCLEWGALEDDLDFYLEEGYYAGGNFSVCISWSDI